jgi:oligogalacturonide lyase
MFSRIAPRRLCAIAVIFVSAFARVLCGQNFDDAELPRTGPAPLPAPAPKEWIDKATGHRVVRLSEEDRSQSPYFHYYPYTADGKRLLFSSPTGIYTVDLATRQIEPLVKAVKNEAGELQRVGFIVVGHKRGLVYFSRGGFGNNRGQAATIYSINPDTKEEREIVKLARGSLVGTVNADETLLAGSITDRPASQEPGANAAAESGAVPGLGAPVRVPRNRRNLGTRLDLHLPMDLITVDIATGEIKKIHHSTDWLNHLQFSPTDPQRLMFAHEGPWQRVDRVWSMNVTSGEEPKLVHKRMMTMEIAGHEFFGQDGKTMWYDLQTPKSEVFWLAGYELATGKRTWYHMAPEEWSVHFNVSPDGQLFAGDGGGPHSVAAPHNGTWIYLFRPELPRNDRSLDGENSITAGRFASEKLVDMSHHDYELEPNVTFTPDGKWIVFRSNMYGPSHVFAVEIAKAN